MAAARERLPLVLGLVALTSSLASYALPSGRDGEVRASREPPPLGEFAPVSTLPTPPIRSLSARPQAASGAVTKPAELAQREAPPPSRTVYLPEPNAAAGAPVADPANGSAESDLYARWSGEQRDPTWTAEMSEYLRETSAAAGLDSDTVVQDADCGSSICRVDLRFDSYDQAGAFQESAHNPDLRYQSMPQADGDGLDVVVYVPRPAQGG